MIMSRIEGQELSLLSRLLFGKRAVATAENKIVTSALFRFQMDRDDIGRPSVFLGIINEKASNTIKVRRTV